MDIELRSGITYVVELFSTKELGHVRRVTIVGGTRTHWSVKVRRDILNDSVALEVIGNEWSKLNEVDAAPLEATYQKGWRAAIEEL